jgi:hypothetical protein
MAVDVVAINSVTGCCDDTGGPDYAWYVDLAYVTGITTVSGQITNLTMSTTGKLKRLDFTRNDTARFAQPGEEGPTGRIKGYAQVGTMVFACVNKTNTDAADLAATVCNLLVIWVMNNGTRRVQGIEIDATATGGFTPSKLKAATVIPAEDSGTGAETTSLTFTINSRSKKLSPYTSLTDTALAAL